MLHILLLSVSCNITCGNQKHMYMYVLKSFPFKFIWNESGGSTWWPAMDLNLAVEMYEWQPAIKYM